MKRRIKKREGNCSKTSSIKGIKEECSKKEGHHQVQTMKRSNNIYPLDLSEVATIISLL